MATILQSMLLCMPFSVTSLVQAVHSVDRGHASGQFFPEAHPIGRREPLIANTRRRPIGAFLDSLMILLAPPLPDLWILVDGSCSPCLPLSLPFPLGGGHGSTVLGDGRHWYKATLSSLGMLHHGPSTQFLHPIFEHLYHEPLPLLCRGCCTITPLRLSPPPFVASIDTNSPIPTFHVALDGLHPELVSVRP